VAYVRTVKTASGAIGVQIVWSSRRGSRQIEHIGSAHDDGELEALLVAARDRLAAGQQTLDLGLDQGASRPPSGPLPILGSQAVHLWDALLRAYGALGFDRVAGADEVFRQLVGARIVEPTSRFHSLRVLGEVGVPDIPSYITLRRRLPGYATAEFAAALAAACAAHAALGPASLVLYDVSTLYFETDTADDFRKPGFSKERRLEPQITIGLLTGQSVTPNGGFDKPLSKAEVLAKAGRWHDAITEFEGVGSAGPLAGEAAYQRARASSAFGLGDAARAELRDVMDRYAAATGAASSAMYLFAALLPDDGRRERHVRPGQLGQSVGRRTQRQLGFAIRGPAEVRDQDQPSAALAYVAVRGHVCGHRRCDASSHERVDTARTEVGFAACIGVREVSAGRIRRTPRRRSPQSPCSPLPPADASGATPKACAGRRSDRSSRHR